MKFNGQNIIADSDIVMTGQLTGHTLSDILTQHTNDINNLKGNVKWIYKYGGVGSGSGGGSQSSTPWNFKVELDEVVRENGTKINLGKLKEYKLTIQLYKVQGRTFTVKYTYDTPQGIKVTERVIPPTQQSSIVDYIDLQINGTLAISINDDEGNYDLFIVDYIVTAYSFKLDYVYADDKSLYIPSNNNIFVSAVASRGILARFTSIVSVDIESYYIEYYDWNQELHTINLDPDEKYFYFELGKEINNDNSGNYQFRVIPHITLGGKNEEESISELFLLSDNLIPDNIYLKVEVDGTIYKHVDGFVEPDKPYLFYAGTIPFFVTGFLGFPDNTKPYSIQVYLNGERYTLDGIISELQDQIQYELKIQTELLEWNTVRFVISRKEETYDITYHFYTKSPLGSFLWYPSQTIEGNTTNIYPAISYLYKQSSAIHNQAIAIPNTNKNLISMTSSTGSKNYQIPISDNEYKSKDCLISIGIKYNKLNDIRNAILLLQGSNSSNNIIIYQNKISIMGTEYSNFYLPIGDDLFHLVTIYRRAVSSENNAPLFEIVVYIDGVIECALPGFTAMLETYKTITLYSGLYLVNYLEISYFNHDPLTTVSNDLFELYNPNPTKYPITYLTDSSILYHYYSYKLTFYPESIPKDFEEAYSYVSQFYNNSKTGRTEVTKTLIQNIATTASVPVLLIKYEEAKDTSLSNWSSDGSAFMNWMEKAYDITIDTGATNVGYRVSVEYSKGKEELTPIDISTKFPNAYFELFLQGTSTLNYRGKNFDLAINSPEEDYTYLYSPNFEEGDYNTFLPETRFTIKADIVDSSHSNNNSIGKFINTITTKFEEAKLENNKYNPYLKNTLEGFPVLLFLQNSYYENSTVNTPKDDYYFLGISNFNLGRDSEFNLGYKDLRLLPQTIQNGFAVTRIDNDVKVDNSTTISSKSYLGDLGVMEIRENRNYFDFSQSHSSILFPLSDSDTDYMFSKFKCNNLDILKSKIQELVLGISKGGGYIFDQLGKNMVNKSDSDRLGYGYDEGYKTHVPLNIVPNYKVLLKRTFENAESVLTPTGVTINGTQNDLLSVLLGDETTGEDPLVDYKSLSEYYVICMALGLLDSVLKNMNFRKWKNKFYLAFYDMDTSLGKDNAGNDSDYICFSDYWEPNKSTLGGSTILEPAISYKDWYDINKSGGYDVPSSYLFALTKYGYHILNDPELKDWYPQNLWARFRRNNTNIPGWSFSNSDNANHIGCLKNANQFIDNYFNKHLENVPDVIFNLNYRNKYLQVEQETRTSYSTDYNKFSGRRIHYVKDWLNARFHLLDLYFNLANVSDSVLTYDMSTETWNTVPNTTYANPDALFIDNTNPDILVLQDAFTSGDGSTKYSQNVNVNFTADSHSPLSLSGAKIARYITEDNTTIYTLNVDCNGKALNLGGSRSWLTLSSINTLIQGNKLYVNSDKLTTLTGTTGLCNKWTLNMPALTTVSLTSSLYSDILTFHGKEKWPNLNSININNSKLSLNLDNVSVLTINALNVGPALELTLVNCSSIKTLNLNNSVFNSITMTALQPVTFFSKYKYTKDDSDNWKITSILADSPKCKYLTLKRPDGYKDGVLFISDLLYENNGSTEGLEEITLKGYLEIYISDCPYLSKITIEDPSTVKILHVLNSGSLGTSLSINASGALNTIDLSTFSSLEEVNFKESKKFYYVTLPERSESNGVLLAESAFYMTNLLYLSGSNIKLNKRAFSNSLYTLLKTDKSTISSFYIRQDITDLTGLFHASAVLLSEFKTFNSTYAQLLNYVTVTDNMWSYTPCVVYNADMLLEDMNKSTSRFDLSMYTRVTSAKQMLGGPSTTSCNMYTLKDFAKNSSSVNMQNFYGWNIKANQEITIPENWLNYVADKVTDCSTTEPVIYKVVYYLNNILNVRSEFNPSVLFSGGSTNKLESLQNWVFHEDHTINFENSLTSTKFPKLTKITKSFVGCKAKNLEYVLNSNQEVLGFLYSNPYLVEISGSFGFTNYNQLTVSLDTYLNWESLLSSTSAYYKGFLYEVNWDEKYHVMEFNKTISSVENFNLIYNCLMKSYNASSLAHVFRNCVINVDDINPQMSFTRINTLITKVPYLFNNLSLTNGEGLNWDWNIINSIPNAVDFRYTFKGVKFKGSIPFNFFKRRIALTPTKVYIKNSENAFEEASLYKYSYTSNITNLTHTFENCEFEIPTYDFNEDNIPNNKARLMQGDIILDIKEYYTGNSVFSTKYLLENTEFDDMGKKVAYALFLNADYNLVRNTVDYTSQQYNNYDLEYTQGDVSKPVIPTDFFYGCSNTADLSSCFEGSNLQGYIPDYALKNCKNATLSNFLKGTLIFPKYYDSRYSVNVDTLLHIYYYIGPNFSTNTNLDNAFNFRIHLPGTKALDENLLHVFCFSDSFSVNLTSIKDGLPKDIEQAPEGCFFAILHLDHDIYMNMMYDKKGETTTSYSQDAEGNDITTDSDGNPIELKPIIGDLGFKMSLYSYLQADKLVNELYSQFTYGNVFDTYTTLNSLKKISNWVIKLGGNLDNNGNIINTFGVSKYAIWPAANSANTKTIYTSATYYYFENNEWGKGDGTPMKIYTTNVSNYGEKTSTYYNSSKYNTTSWNINFIDYE